MNLLLLQHQEQADDAFYSTYGGSSNIQDDGGQVQQGTTYYNAPVAHRISSSTGRYASEAAAADELALIEVGDDARTHQLPASGGFASGPAPSNYISSSFYSEPQSYHGYLTYLDQAPAAPDTGADAGAQPPVGRFTVAHPQVVKRRLVQPPATAVLGLANPQPTEWRSGHPIVRAPRQLGYHSANQIAERISMILVTQLFECPNNRVTGPPFSGLGIGETKDCPGWRLDQPVLDDWRVCDRNLTNWRMTRYHICHSLMVMHNTNRELNMLSFAEHQDSAVLMWPEMTSYGRALVAGGDAASTAAGASSLFDHHHQVHHQQRQQQQQQQRREKPSPSPGVIDESNDVKDIKDDGPRTNTILDYMPSLVQLRPTFAAGPEWQTTWRDRAESALSNVLDVDYHLRDVHSYLDSLWGMRRLKRSAAASYSEHMIRPRDEEDEGEGEDKDNHKNTPSQQPSSSLPRLLGNGWQGTWLLGRHMMVGPASDAGRGGAAVEPINRYVS
ncbi:unnamed protein product [Notodromas monacha]|uniref:Uncharacterized protein n=1 Tax=Notodromas monacha TaxID=399045 RepID=A0A7R9BH15_9CRUS|nr:unnamed protein product [Notodromas monacha]CAG0914625.1 unnamed protein product [Notodromas monacha]